MDEEELAMAMAMAAAASSECSSGCQSGWTTYLDDDHTSSYNSCGTGTGTARFHHGGSKARQPYCGEYEYSEEEEEDLSMISDASSGPRQQQSSAGNDGGAAAVHARRRGRREETTTAAAAARRHSKRAAAAASLLEDTASSPAFFGYCKHAMSSGDSSGYGGGADAKMREIGNAADFSYAFSTTTGCKSPLSGDALSGYMQMHYSPSPAPVKPMPRRQVSRDASEKKRW